MEGTKKAKFMAVIQIINALIWAVIILISSYTLKGFDNYDVVFYSLIVGSGLQISLLTYISDRLIMKKNCTPQLI
jgi:hypothetical protein